MNIAIIGTGYVGLVTGTCFAELGNTVVCVDNAQKKISDLQRQSCPIYEPGLQELIKKNVTKKRLTFTTDGAEAIQASEIVFNCVGTPLNKKGFPDLTETHKVARLFAKNLNNRKIFVNKSTVPVGTGAECKKIILSISKKDFHIVSNPEFLRQGTAVKDFMEPERVIIGTENKQTAATMKKLYSPIMRAGKTLITTDIKTAELVKYAANAFIATKISFINEIAGYCEKTGINIGDVSKAIGLDSRIGPKYLNAGIGYGGGCLSKDVKSLISIGRREKSPFGILEKVSVVNTGQRRFFIKKIIDILKKTHAAPCKIAVWGLAYKPHTDDLRDSPAVEIINALIKAGHILHLYDPAAVANAQKQLPPSTRLKYFTDGNKAATGTAALIILTEWPEFVKTDLKKLKTSMSGRHIFDGRNIFNSDALTAAGFEYHGIANTPDICRGKKS